MFFPFSELLACSFVFHSKLFIEYLAFLSDTGDDNGWTEQTQSSQGAESLVSQREMNFLKNHINKHI